VGQVATFTFRAITQMDGTITNTASISSTSIDSILTNNTTTVKTLVTEIQFFIPKAFTPNGDGKNDLFQIGGLDPYPDNYMEIFNRWGNLVYKSTGYGKNGSNWWDGSGLSDGTYYYFLHINLGTKTKILSGYIMLLRNLNH
jgi:gliding motility-associated-like protein